MLNHCFGRPEAGVGPTHNAESLLRPEAGVGVNGEFSSIYLYLSVYSGILCQLLTTVCGNIWAV